MLPPSAAFQFLIHEAQRKFGEQLTRPSTARHNKAATKRSELAHKMQRRSALSVANHKSRATSLPRVTVIRETHEPTESIVLALTLAGGKNPFGEPNYRAVWGWNRLAWIGGKFEEHDPSTGSLLREVVELRQEPKYPAVNRWHIEKWLPAEAYGSPRAWWAQTIEVANGRNIPALGPYPARGDYEHCMTLEGPSMKGRCGEFVQLTATAAEHIARAIEWSRKHPRAKARRSLYERETREDQDYEDFAYDILDEAVPAFHKQPFVTVL
jgi:hypothetical protein